MVIVPTKLKGIWWLYQREVFVVSLDSVRIANAIIECDASPMAREEGARLVDAWVARWLDEDSNLRVIAVECGFHIWLDELTLVVGVSDLITEDRISPFANEWKSAKAPQLKKDGTPNAYWNEHVWLENIVRGPQLSIYALALHEGTYYDSSGQKYQFNVENPRVRVRACVKSDPVEFWPTRPEDAVYEFPGAGLGTVRNALLARAGMIRHLRASNLMPWQLMGKQCYSRFRRDEKCRFWGVCESRVPPPITRVFDSSNPAGPLALKHVDPERLARPGMVVLSATSYETGSNCAEAYRIELSERGENESNLALDTGTALHCGVAEMYRQIKEGQNAHA